MCMPVYVVLAVPVVPVVYSKLKNLGISMKRFALLLSLFPSLLLSLEMTLEEKVGQVLMVHFHGDEVNEDARRLVQDLHVGAITYYNWSNGLSSPEQVARLSAGLQEMASIPLLIAVDQEGGRVVRLKDGFPVFSSNQSIAQMQDSDLAEYAAYVTGLALRAVGVNMNLAPVVDVNCNPLNPVINTRSFGDTPQTVVAFAEKALQGYHKAGITTSLKHFPGHGDVEVDSHLTLPRVNKSLDQLEQVELLPFRTLAASADSIMTAHILMPALDPNQCATVSPLCLGYLRNELGFTGVIVSDSLVMEGVVSGCSTVDEAAIRALNAGCDLLILGGRQLVGGAPKGELTTEDITRIHQGLVTAVKSNRILETRVNEAVQRILDLKRRYALMPATVPTKTNSQALLISDKDLHVIAQKIWQNECHGSVEGLTHWNSGENFGSFGIGHFIWYPEGKSERFRETFPDLLAFLQKEGVQLPQWLKQAQGCPWATKEEFTTAKDSVQMQQLRKLLFDTRAQQAAFIAKRAENSLTVMPASLNQVFNSLVNDPRGLYAVIDYVNFKGEGSSITESYNGSGWGLIQVLERITTSSTQPVDDFVKAAKLVLLQRVENSPKERNEKQWLNGWFRRLETYSDEW